MIGLALKMLIRDRAKYAMLVSGLAFCALLISQQAGIFCGLMLWTTATIRNLGAPIWVTDPAVEQANELIPLRQAELNRIRGLDGVGWAMPVYVGLEQVRLPQGKFQSVQLVGLDAGTLAGRPMDMLEGATRDLRSPNAVIVDQVAVEAFRRKGVELKLGTIFEINDREARVVGLCKVARSFLGQPYIYTTYDRALEYARPSRKRLSTVIVSPRDGWSAAEVASDIERQTGLRAMTATDLHWQTIWWYIRNTGIPISFGTVVVLGVVVGIAIAGQTFYLFIHDNIRYFAALKAMGAGLPIILGMIGAQALAVGFVGYGLGMGLMAGFGRAAVENEQPPFYLPWQVPIGVAVLLALICGFAASIGLVKIARLEPATVFK